MNEFPMEYDTVILVPSALDVDRKLMDVFKQVKATDKVVDRFYSILKAEAYQARDLKAIEEYCQNRCGDDSGSALDLKERILDTIDSCFEKMEGEYFKAKDMDKECLQFISRVVSPKNKYTVEQASELIRDKRVVVLDETLWAGSAASVCVQNILGYGPSELCVMTSESK